MFKQKDQFNLNRFIEAQDQVYQDVVRELKCGKKQSHWMWFIFPQIKGLGSSRKAVEYSIKSIDEAAGYISHPLLSKRLYECVTLALSHKGKDVTEVFGEVDTLKLCSSMTLFDEIDPESIFNEALTKLFDNTGDENTYAILNDFKKGLLFSS